MTATEFTALCDDVSLQSAPAAVHGSPLLLALWHDRRGHWDTAHTIAQGINSSAGSAVHAYLHREEGDLSNAQYWYARSGRAMPQVALDHEWHALAEEFCAPP